MLNRTRSPSFNFESADTRSGTSSVAPACSWTIIRSADSADRAGRRRQIVTPITVSGDTLSTGTFGVAILYERLTDFLPGAGLADFFIYAVSHRWRVGPSSWVYETAVDSKPAQQNPASINANLRSKAIGNTW